MNIFEDNIAKYTLLERTLHREKNGGFEVWRLEINDDKYIFYSDIRWLEEINERVIIVDFYNESSLDNVANDLFSLTGNSSYNASKVYRCIANLAVNILPPIRKYRYVAMVGKQKLAGIHKKLINRYGDPVSSDVTEAVLKKLFYSLYIEIDAGISHCEVGDLITNPNFIAAGLDKEENRQEVNLEPVSLNG